MLNGQNLSLNFGLNNFSTEINSLNSSTNQGQFRITQYQTRDRLKQYSKKREIVLYQDMKDYSREDVVSYMGPSPKADSEEAEDDGQETEIQSGTSLSHGSDELATATMGIPQIHNSKPSLFPAFKEGPTSSITSLMVLGGADNSDLNSVVPEFVTDRNIISPPQSLL